MILLELSSVQLYSTEQAYVSLVLDGVTHPARGGP
jgi:hypothetical protein